MAEEAAAKAEGAVRRKRRGSEKRARPQGVFVRLTPVEQAQAQEAAAQAGLSLASFARVQMLGKPGLIGVRRRSRDVEQLARLLAQIGKIGSNLNQIARAANTNLMAISDYEMLRGEAEELRGLRAALMQALGRAP